ncbi:MAG: hypothetical protein AAGC63_09255 [Propionicimonas sp.]|nr:hypothetical protein [Propionicimonas sp.]
MDLPDEYLDVLTDELAPFGIEFSSAESDPDGQWQIRFEVEPESFVHRYPWTDIDTSYGDAWPPEALELWIRVEGRDVFEITFEVYDVLLWAQAESPELAGRLGTLDDPEDQAAAVGQALAELLRQPDRDYDNLG